MKCLEGGNSRPVGLRKFGMTWCGGSEIFKLALLLHLQDGQRTCFGLAGWGQLDLMFHFAGTSTLTVDGINSSTCTATTSTTTFNHHNHSTNHDCMTELDAAWSGPIPIFETYPGMQRKAHLVKISKSTLPPVENWWKLARSSKRSIYYM